MKTFFVIGVEQTSGDERRLEIQAESQNAAAANARADGIFPTDVRALPDDHNNHGLPQNNEHPLNSSGFAAYLLAIIVTLIVLGIGFLAAFPSPSRNYTVNQPSFTEADRYSAQSLSREPKSTPIDYTRQIAINSEIEALKEYVSTLVASDRRFREQIRSVQAEGSRVITNLGVDSELGHSTRRLLQLRLDNALSDYHDLKIVETTRIGKTVARIIKAHPASDGNDDIELATWLGEIIAPAIRAFDAPL